MLLVSAIVATVSQRLRLPYTVGLVLAGVVMALTSATSQVHLTKHLIFNAFLPPLIFEAAYFIPWTELRRDFSPITVLATVGVLIAAAVTAAGMHFGAQWSWPSALLFGVLISATDPVSVIATFKDAGVHGRLRLLVEAESLFNDGTAAVLFAVVSAALLGAGMSAGAVVLSFVVTVVGGVLCGALVGAAALLLIGRATDHLVEISFTVVAAYGSFLLAEQFHLSGVLATLTAGMLIGNIGPARAITDRGREAVGAFWEYAAFLANSLIFLLIGLRGARESFAALLVPTLIAIAVVLAGRAASVYGCCAFYARAARRISLQRQHILFWGGLRGALALALALGLPPETPDRSQILTVTFGVVAFSIIVQGLTITPLLRRLGEIETKPHS
ncbi:sodium/hydrogen exchanger [Capsulimonas corticalis]|uniref:Sodium/hydrogen exchanger n=1 Tax=Capsulimonas corticalis TaxID=2219043 RepID=A0A402CRD5_9BACT|nr:sodium:proton antiporter [Capsulimonas corticalis]BDI28059.1 sodium/hydrogen exchanger [Capsulimonas corticalis]